MADRLMTIEEMNAFLARNPFNHWLGLSVQSVAADGVELRARWRGEFVSNPDLAYTHGGVLAALIDVGATYAIAARLGRPLSTIDLRVDYHSLALPGDLLVRGRILKLGKTVSTAEASILNLEGRLLSSGRGVFLTTQVRKPSAQTPSESAD